MARQTGYLASITNAPPLIFRFQFNPDILSEKKSFKYTEVPDLGTWAKKQSSIALMRDIKSVGPQITATKALAADSGEQRQFSIDFSLDAVNPGPMDGDSHYNGSIDPDLALLRAFLAPSLDMADLYKVVTGGALDRPWNQPPDCTLVYGGLSVTCVMTDLNIKVIAFQDDGRPQRADVSATLKEQTFGISPPLEFVKRYFDIGKSYVRQGFLSDVVAVTPGVNEASAMFK